MKNITGGLANIQWAVNYWFSEFGQMFNSTLNIRFHISLLYEDDGLETISAR